MAQIKADRAAGIYEDYQINGQTAEFKSVDVTTNCIGSVVLISPVWPLPIEAARFSATPSTDIAPNGCAASEAVQRLKELIALLVIVL